VVVGPSGAGKSSLLRLCNRLELADGGSVSFHGEDVRGMDPIALRRRVGMVFQTPTPFGGTVRDNLRVARPDLDDAAARRVLRRAALDPALLDRRAADLSGGEAQRMCVARTLVSEPEVLLMDEPTSSLDLTATLALEELARTLVAESVASVWVTHDLDQMRRLADQVLVVVDGTLVHIGRRDDLERDAPPGVARFLRGSVDE
jgi:putative ABC transport system ATP-binding protein